MAKFELGRTARQTLEEIYADVRNDERGYGEALLTIVTKSGVEVAFRDNVPQRRMDEVCVRSQQAGLRLLALILKYRQAGSSVWWMKKAHLRMMSRWHHKVLIVAQDKDIAKEDLEFGKYLLNCWPAEIRPRIVSDNETTLKILPQNSAMICASAKSAHALRGFIPPPRTGIFTEAAYYGENGGSFEALVSSGLQAIPDVPDVIVAAETTGNGTEDEFYDYWVEVVNDDNPVWSWLFLEWFLDPQYEKDFHDHSADRARGITWEELRYIRDNCKHCHALRMIFKENVLDKDEDIKERMQRYKWTYEQANFYWLKLAEFKGDRLKLQQEYPCTWKEAFIAAGSPVFDTVLLQRIKTYQKRGKLYDAPLDAETFDDLSENPTLVRGKDVYLEVWDEPRDDHRYLIAADSSEGKKKSNPCAACVYDINSMHVVAILHGRIEPDPYADYLTRIGRIYDIALQVPERNNMGIAVINKMIEAEYPNIYQKHILRPTGWEETEVIGWETNVQTKPFIIGLMRKVLFAFKDKPETLAQMFPSEQLIDDLMKYTRSKASGATKAKYGAEDDLPMAAMIGLGACHQELGIGYSEESPLVQAEKAKQKKKEEEVKEKRKNKNVDYHEWRDNFKKFLAGHEFNEDGEIVDARGDVMGDFTDDDEEETERYV